MFAFPPFPGPARETPTAKSCTLDASSALDPGTWTSQSWAVPVLRGFALLSMKPCAFFFSCMSFVRELIQFFAWNPQVPECALFEQREMVSLQTISHYQRVQSYYLSVLLYWNRDQCSKIPTVSRLNDAALSVLFSYIQFCFLIQ